MNMICSVDCYFFISVLKKASPESNLPPEFLEQFVVLVLFPVILVQRFAPVASAH